MIRHLILATLAAFALGGCATDYAYRGGTGDYYYGQPSVQYHDYYGYGALYGSLYGYGYPYGGWRSGLSIGYGYGYGRYGYPYGYYGGGYPYYYNPWYWYWRRHDQRPPPTSEPEHVTGGPLPPSRVDNDPRRGAVSVMPRNGGRPLRLPATRPWRGHEGIERPRLSRPAPRAVYRPDRGRAEVDAPPMSRPAPRMVRQPAGGTREVAPRPAPRVSLPSRPATPSPSRKSDRVREQLP